MKLSVIVPVYNEETSVTELVERVKAVPVDKEIITVDDHSRDNTLAVLNRIPGIRVISHPVNRGKGAAVRTGLAQATGDVVVIQDADLEYSPDDYPVMLEPFSDPRVDAVYGSRFRGSGNSFLLHSKLANYLLTFFTNALFGGRITDMETCYKLIRRPLFQGLDLVANRFEIEPEITAKLLRKHCRIAEVPIQYNARKAGKKIGPRDGVAACIALARWYVR
ncbi:glycosyltransferase family 2 protein [candidate division WOR-3 bacterium]|nr:glycosyltransferase family 2 protein [candidate division WOR-3 bacterium]